MSTNHDTVTPPSIFSTLSERIKHTPIRKDRVIWLSGNRGEGLCIPKSPKVIKALKTYGLIGIYYASGNPIFSQCSLIYLPNVALTLNRYKNFAECNRLCAEEWNKICFEGHNNWTPSSVKHWIKINQYSWHECIDMHSCELVPRIIHSYFNHMGGIAELKRAIKYKNTNCPKQMV